MDRRLSRYNIVGWGRFLASSHGIRKVQNALITFKLGLIFSLSKRGVLQLSQLIQLRQLADKRQDPRHLEGAKIIEESYQPYTSKTFVSAQRKGATGWETIPLNMTEVWLISHGSLIEIPWDLERDLYGVYTTYLPIRA